MKKGFLFLSVALLSIVFVSCKKDDAPVDARDKFVGRWFGNFNLSIPAVGVNETDTLSHFITKNPANANQIIIDSIQYATVNGDSFTYLPYTDSETDPSTGVTTTFTINGSGAITNGTNMTENFTINITSAGVTLNGTMSANLTKQ
ncbi:MAG: hypothetical protein RIR96_594 [Bacteroidota bacterium]|jgi:hypothetical protein